MAMKPNARPELSRADLVKIIEANKINRKEYPVVFVGIVSYFLDSMGKRGVNDIGIYDDAIFIDAPGGMKAFNANCDPSVYRRRIATLVPGKIYHYKMGDHRIGKPTAYPAFRQLKPVLVDRYGIGIEKLDSTINIHKGGLYTTSSLGCQTIYPSQWKEMKEFGYAELKAAKQKAIPYLLIKESDRRAGKLELAWYP